MKTIKGVLVDTKNGIKEIALEIKDYTDIVDLCKCDYITCVTRKIGGVIVDVYCDEEALLKSAREPSIITRKNGTIIEVLFGNCFICKHNRNGDIMSLSRNEIAKVLDAKASMWTNGKDFDVLQSEF